MQKELRAKGPQPDMTITGIERQAQDVFTPAPDYNPHREHHRNFFNAIRGGPPVVEDAAFGLRAAGPSLLANTSYFERRVCRWDAEKMSEVRG